jgi:aspartate/methionine/tyrosine aminotransferase
MQYKRMPIEVESPEETGYDTIQYNLAESSVRDIYFRDLKINLDGLFLCYSEHRGKKELRQEIVRHENGLDEDHVLVCPSAATSLFVISTTLLSAQDHLIVLRPNYATNIETPRTIGCEITYVDLSFENGFQFDLEAIKREIRPNTKLISITSPHNPTGIVFEDALLKKIITLAEEQNIYVLVDETYRYLNFKSELTPYYAAVSKNVISVCSLSKAFGAPGIRIGWLINKDEKLMHAFLAAKEQIVICNSVVDEEIALHILQQQESLLSQTHQHILKNFSVLKSWMGSHELLEWKEPDAGVVCFPRVKKDFKFNAEKFYPMLYNEYKTIVGPGHWFEQDRRYMRIGFAYPFTDELTTGLNNITACLEKCL